MDLQTSRGSMSANVVGPYYVAFSVGNIGNAFHYAEVKHLIKFIESQSNPDFRHREMDTRFLVNVHSNEVFNIEGLQNGGAKVMFGLKSIFHLWFNETESWQHAYLTAEGLQQFYSVLLASTK